MEPKLEHALRLRGTSCRRTFGNTILAFFPLVILFSTARHIFQQKTPFSKTIISTWVWLGLQKADLPLPKLLSVCFTSVALRVLPPEAGQNDQVHLPFCTPAPTRISPTARTTHFALVYCIRSSSLVIRSTKVTHYWSTEQGQGASTQLQVVWHSIEAFSIQLNPTFCTPLSQMAEEQVKAPNKTPNGLLTHPKSEFSLAAMQDQTHSRLLRSRKTKT